MDDRFVNLSDEVRRRSDLRKADESLLSTEIDLSVRESFVGSHQPCTVRIVRTVRILYGNLPYLPYLPATTCRRLPAAGKYGKSPFLTGGKSATGPSCRGGKQPYFFVCVMMTFKRCSCIFMLVCYMLNKIRSTLPNYAQRISKTTDSSS
jgi:hypothetical protein